jgi:hypothetical protein
VSGDQQLLRLRALPDRRHRVKQRSAHSRQLRSRSRLGSLPSALPGYLDLDVENAAVDLDLAGREER